MVIGLFLACDSSAPVGLSVKVQLLGVQGLQQHQGCRDTNCLSHRSNGPNRIFFQPLATCDQRASLASPSLLICSFRNLNDHPWEDHSLLVGTSGTQRGPLTGFYSVVQLYICQLKADLSTVQLPVPVFGETEATVMAQQYHLAFMTAWFFSTGIFHHTLLLHIPLDLSLHCNLYTLAPRCCAFQGTCVLVRVRYGCSKDCLCDSYSIQTVTSQLFHSQPQIFLLCPKQLPHCGDQTLVSVLPPGKGRSSPGNSPLFPTTSFILLNFSWFPVVQYSCSLSAGVLQDLLCLKVQS